jgi:hypothetical protein
VTDGCITVTASADCVAVLVGVLVGLFITVSVGWIGVGLLAGSVFVGMDGFRPLVGVEVGIDGLEVLVGVLVLTLVGTV